LRGTRIDAGRTRNSPELVDVAELRAVQLLYALVAEKLGIFLISPHYVMLQPVTEEVHDFRG
jgi:hypothetical protein